VRAPRFTFSWKPNIKAQLSASVAPGLALLDEWQLLTQNRQGRSLIFGRQPSQGQLTLFAAVIAVMERPEHDPKATCGNPSHYMEPTCLAHLDDMRSQGHFTPPSNLFRQ
jgi:hypothetical protein